MNVAIFTDHPFGEANGIRTSLTAAVDCAPSSVRLRVYSVATETIETGDYIALPGVLIPRSRVGPFDVYLPRFNAYIERARADRIDVVHLTTPGPMGLAGVLTAWRLALPVIGSFHSDLASPIPMRTRRLYIRWLNSQCDRVLAQSEATRRLLVDAGTAPAVIEVWRTGVDTSTFSPDKKSSELRKLWSVSESRPALLYAGGASLKDDVHMLPRIQARLFELGIHHRFIIAGPGPMHEALRNHMPDAVFARSLSGAEAAEVFASADALVSPGCSDPAADIVLKAQACGLPVVVSEMGGPRENMIDGTTGLVVAGTDATRWADTVARVLRGPRAVMSAAACEFARGRSWERALEPLYRSYLEVACPYDGDSIGIDPIAFPVRRR
jgi:glycosyltransferase involved in cell wall biosynthesis